MPKADLYQSIATAGGSRRNAAPKKEAAAASSQKEPTSPLTLHYPKQVRTQIKMLAAEQDKTMHNLMAEFINDGFAKYGKPEIAPITADES